MPTFSVVGLAGYIYLSFLLYTISINAYSTIWLLLFMLYKLITSLSNRPVNRKKKTKINV